jgi:hypothetical protein
MVSVLGIDYSLRRWIVFGNRRVQRENCCCQTWLSAASPPGHVPHPRAKPSPASSLTNAPRWRCYTTDAQRVDEWIARNLLSVETLISRQRSLAHPPADTIARLDSWRQALLSCKVTHKVTLLAADVRIMSEPEELATCRAIVGRGARVTLLRSSSWKSGNETAMYDNPLWWYVQTESGITGWMHNRGFLDRIPILSSRAGGEENDISPVEVEGGRG